VDAFVAAIEEAPRGGAYVEVPADVVDALGGGGRIPVRATFDGVAYRGSIVTMGGAKVIGILKSIRTELGKSSGDRIEVTVELDAAERTVDVPADLDAALGEAGLRDVFAELSYSHRREYVRWIDEARKPETRARRVDQTIERIRP
jgi:hypothetical protein